MSDLARHIAARRTEIEEAKQLIADFARNSGADRNRRLSALAASVAAGFGAQARLDYERIYPATINSRAEALFGQQVAEELVGADHVVTDLEPSMGAEDFSFMLRVRPGAYFRIGQGGAEAGSLLHSTRYDFNDAILPIGAALFVRLAEQSMPLGSVA